jgi:hypothetical protein
MAADLGRGSFGVVINAQLDSLRKIREAKEYAKATKSDDSAVNPAIWNRGVSKPGVSDEERDRALEGFRKLGLRMFRSALRRDCASFLREKYGSNWTSEPRETGGHLTALGRDLQAIRSMLWHCTQTNWFEYGAGSRLIFFRFPLRYRRIARDGVPIHFEGPGPTTKEPQPRISDPARREKVKGKLRKVLSRRYILTTGLDILSFIKYFDVPKGVDDIRMVYDATANGLNDVVWVPSFWLPTIESVVRALDSTSWMADRDISDMFLNFQLHQSVMPYTGVDLGPLWEDGETDGARMGFWDRMLMGFGPSPHGAIKLALVCEEVVKGDRLDTRRIKAGEEGDYFHLKEGEEVNPFQFQEIRLNLPGRPGYDPTKSWVNKLRADGQVACDLFTFVDDERLIGPTLPLTWQASRRLASTQAYLGIQDAARKVRPCSQTPGAWAGSVVHVVEGLGVCVLLSEEKWARMKDIVEKWRGRLAAGERELNHKELISDRGFLVYATRAYPAMIPYLKGFHLTASSWLDGRDSEGWKVSGPASAEANGMDEAEEEDDCSNASWDSLGSLDITRAGAQGLDLNAAATNRSRGQVDEDGAAVEHLLGRRRKTEVAYAPASGLTHAVPRLFDDVNALTSLMRSELPPLRVVRPTRAVQVLYGFGDASGKQYATTVTEAPATGVGGSPQGIRYRMGLWSASEQEESSNFKEFSNLVGDMEDDARAGRLRGCEFFMFTDNSTTESCFYRGSSTSRILHGLVVRLRALEMEYGLLIHLVHVSGKRMIAQGTDGCSRGSLLEGVMAGRDMLDFVDLGYSATDRCPELVRWIRSWTGESDLEPLPPEGWYVEGHGIVGYAPDRHGVNIPNHGPGGQTFLWCPAPAAADAALEELLKARHKRTDTFHVVAIPRLMLPRWRRLFNKACDFTFVVPPNKSFWPAQMYEPLWVGIVLPFTHHRPWCLKRAPLLVELGVELRLVLEAGEADGGHILRKLYRVPRRLAAVSGRVACGMLRMPGGGNLSHEDGGGRAGEPVA